VRTPRIPLVVKLVAGVILVQAVTVGLVLVWRRAESADVGLTFAALGTAIGFFAALWFASLARGERREAVLRAEAALSRERERHKLATERERARMLERARRQVDRESGRVRSRANLRVGTAVLAVAGMGALLLLTQFLSLGVLLLSSTGGAVAGYLWRARQELRRRAGRAGAEVDGLEAAPQRIDERALPRGGDADPGSPPDRGSRRAREP